MMLAIGLSMITVSVTYAQEQSLIPVWIKDVAEFWAEDEISDKDFVQSIEYLIENSIVSIPQIEKMKTENQQLRVEMQDMENRIRMLEGSYSEITQNDSEKLRITVHTNKQKYGPNDDIIIFGTVNKLVSDHKVGIVISNSSGKILVVAKIAPNNDGSYGFVAKGALYRNSGEYTVNVYYGGQAYSHLTYSYNPLG